jgi:hypothetical protein
MKKVSMVVGVAALVVCVPLEARADDLAVVPVLRVALGPAIRLAPATDDGLRFAADVTAGVAVAPSGMKHVGVVLNPELGYAFDGIGAHAFNLSVGVGYGHPLVYVSYQPRLLAGRAGTDTLVGMRNGLAMHVLADMASLELGHQFVHFNGELHHSFTIMFGVNPAAFVYVLHKL